MFYHTQLVHLCPFDFVYPNKFHPSDFKYKTKWATPEALDNAFYYMHKILKKKKFTLNDILLLNTSDFRNLGLAGMLVSVFEASTLKAKEYYLYKTIGDKQHQRELKEDIKNAIRQKRDKEIKERLSQVAVGKFIYNLHSNASLYNYIKRHARKNHMSISDFIARYGYIYKSARKDAAVINKDDI